MGEPSGEIPLLLSLERLSAIIVGADDPGAVCSASAVVATALAAPANGMPPLENRDEEDIRDARDPDRKGKGTAALRGVDAV